MKKIIFLVIPCLAFVTTLLSGCKESQISSVWNDKKVIIDGKGNEWQCGIKWNEKQKFGYSVANDSSNLYFYLTCTDRDLEKQIMMQGLSLTIQQKGSKGRLLGIKFPLAKSPMGSEMGEMGQMGGRPSQRPDSMPGKQKGQQEDLSSMMDDIQTEMIVLGPGKDDQRILPLVNKQGLIVKINRDRQNLGYEIQIPLKMIAQQLKTEPLSPKYPLKIILKTEKAEKSMGRPEREMGEGSQGSGGRGGFDDGEPPSDGGMMSGQGGGLGGPSGMQGSPEGNSQSSFSFKFAVLLTTDK